MTEVNQTAREAGEATVNGVRLSYQLDGEGEPVVLVCGTGQPAISWHLEIVSRLVAAGYRVLTFDNRGMPPSEETPPPYSVDLLVADAAALIEHLGLGPCRVAGLSLGAMITQELALARPDLVRSAVMMGTAGRGTEILRAWAEEHIALAHAGIELPARYEAVVFGMQVIGPDHLLDDDFMKVWLELYAAAPPWNGPGMEGQYRADLGYHNRLDALRGVRVPSMVIGFEHDLITLPALCREVADAIPSCHYVEVPSCGHAGPIEDASAVVPHLLEFFEKN